VARRPIDLFGRAGNVPIRLSWEPGDKFVFIYLDYDDTSDKDDITYIIYFDDKEPYTEIEDEKRTAAYEYLKDDLCAYVVEFYAGLSKGRAKYKGKMVCRGR
jgi:hypothetical protein